MEKDKMIDSLSFYMIKKMEPKIKKTLYSIPNHYRDDVEQEIKIKIMETTERFLNTENPGYFDFKKAKEKKFPE